MYPPPSQRRLLQKFLFQQKKIPLGILLRLILFFVFLHSLYSVMQSARNSFCGDVVYDSVTLVSGNDDSILDQICLKHICSDLYYDDFSFLNNLRKCIFT